MRPAGLVESITTDGMAPRESRELWSELASSYQRRMSCEYERGGFFRGSSVRMRTRAHQLVAWRSDATTYRRTTRHIDHDSDDDYRLVVPASGHVLLEQDGHEERFGPGAACLMTMVRPFVFAQDDDAQPLLLTVARREVEHRLRRPAPALARLDLTTGLGRVINDLATALLRERGHLDRPQFDAVADRLVELMCLLLVDDERPVDRDRLSEVEAAARLYVRAHAADPDLTGGSVAGALGWSLRQVQLALQQAGTTPRELIREERLVLARERLLSPAYRHHGITELARQLGYSSGSAFSTAFRRRFGVAPRELRRSPDR